MSRLARHAVLPIAVAVALWGCATGQPASGTVAPRYPSYPFPDVPASLHAPPQIVNRHTTGWRRLQGGDTRGATRDFTAVLRAAPAFYPAETGLGFVALAGRQYRPANDRFGAVLKVNPQVPPGVDRAGRRAARPRPRR